MLGPANALIGKIQSLNESQNPFLWNSKKYNCFFHLILTANVNGNQLSTQFLPGLRVNWNVLLTVGVSKLKQFRKQ